MNGRESCFSIQIAGKLIAMQQSLRILTDVPDYADRVNRLETLKNRLEALMSPTVIAAFNTRDVGRHIYRQCLLPSSILIL